MDFAADLGITLGSRKAGAAQAGGAALPIYNVGPLQLAVDGRPTTENFCAAPITPYDVILGESWLCRHGGILDYERCQLGRRGVLDGEFHILDLSTKPSEGGHVDGSAAGTGTPAIPLATVAGGVAGSSGSARGSGTRHSRWGCCRGAAVSFSCSA